ncbi:phospholipase D family protein [Pengzhenrongella sicca]|uniref:Phospholipase n=1 Tax=Pengzhenrongella sicca TaxID=2819238 RepID=A0A8A4ZAQ0_9MICO|nr:phospholipase D family protein [Pengzhenrongella sicca]QTE27963.1 phospholipase [Pengzhenrongella sicca]
MRADATKSPVDPPGSAGNDAPAADPAAGAWFVTDAERANPATALRGWTTGNLVQPLIDGHAYFARLNAVLGAAGPGDQVCFLDFRGDMDERLDGPGSEVSAVLSGAATRGAGVFGLLWRAPARLLRQSSDANSDFAERVGAAGGQVLLDGRTRIAGSHHQKLVVVRSAAAPERDVAFVGGIDLSHSRNDDPAHDGDPQAVPFPLRYGARPPWHDLQVEVHGPAVRELEHTFQERWNGASTLEAPARVRQLYDGAYHLGATAPVLLPPLPWVDTSRPGGHAVQVLRTYPARFRRYPFAPHGERSIAHALLKAFARARSLIYLEDQYLWSRPVADALAGALRANPGLRVIAVVPRYSDNDGAITRVPSAMARRDALRTCTEAGGERFQVVDLENEAGTPIYVHSKVVIVDDLWAIVGSDNLNRRSWTHDSELSVAVVDEAHDLREPRDPAGRGEGAREFARNLRLALACEHLGRAPDDVADLLDPADAADAFARSARTLAAWHADGGAGPRPPGRVRAHRTVPTTAIQRLWATPLYASVYDPDGRPLRDRLRRRP